MLKLRLAKAGSRLHSSNKKTVGITKPKELNTNDLNAIKPELFIKDLVKIHEFYRQFRIEITKISTNQ